MQQLLRGRDIAVGAFQLLVQMALGGLQQAAVELAAHDARLVARPVMRQQFGRQFRIAQQQAAVFVHYQRAQQKGLFVGERIG